MEVEIVVVHPTVTIIQTKTERREVPTAWFPQPPKIGQRWTINFESIKTASEQYAVLNQYLRRG